jgi:acyl-CoA reductase-like NAD-dependent aldehyde dehydrogenase
LARCTLELGGKSPAIVLDDFDIGKAAETIASGMTYVSGQVCHSLTRIIVNRSRHDALVDALADVVGNMTVGDPFDPHSDIGPLATAQQRDRVEHYIAIGKTEATLAAGGKRPAHLNRGYFIEPTVFGNVSNEHVIAREEIFGPVLSVIPADNDEHAVRIANDTIFGLNSTIFTTDLDRFAALAPRLRAGTVGHNASRTDFSIAFGGMKQSGIGREGGIEGLRPFLESKTIVFDQPWQG